MSNYLKPVSGRISSKFGNRIHPITGQKMAFHNGVDIACAIGTEIVAPESGMVTDVYTHPRGGNSLVMVTSTGVRLGFAHLKTHKVAKNSVVNKGDVIALSGNSGASTGPHVHFTMKINDQFVDPQKYIQF
jgi:murein DD-endopeptidase MepM/ murein hydrolase activator NlpD